MVPNNLIENVVRKVILEYSGVSDEIMDISQEILTLIFETEKGYDWKVSRTTGDYYKRFSLPIEGTKTSRIVNGVLIKLFYYNPNDMDFYMAREVYAESGEMNLSFSTSRETIKLYIPFPGNGVMDNDGVNYLLKAINHEVKHAYQHRMRGGTTIPLAYFKSVTQSEDNGGEKNLKLSAMRQDIKNLYYVFDKDEVDARLQEIYLELLNNNGNLNKCRTYVGINNGKRRYKQLMSEILSPKNSFNINFRDELKRMLGDEITPKQFFYHCESGIKRFDEHVRRIIGRYKREHETSNGSFKYYAKNEIPQSGVFQNGGK